MDPKLLLILCPLIFFAGLVDSVAGGGGMISLSAYLAVGLDPHMALGSNKFSSSCSTIVSSSRFILNKKVDLRAVLTSAISALFGSAIGAVAVQFVDGTFVAYLVVAVIPFIAYFVLKEKNFGSVDKSEYHSKRQIFMYSVAIGLGAGFYDGFFGPGTGTFLIMIYTYFLHYDLVTASGNAKLVNLASNLSAVITFFIGGKIYLLFAVPAAICGIAGSYIGSGLAIKNGARIIRPMLVIVLGLLVIYIVLRNFLKLF